MQQSNEDINVADSNFISETHVNTHQPAERNPVQVQLAKLSHSRWTLGFISAITVSVLLMVTLVVSGHTSVSAAKAASYNCATHHPINEQRATVPGHLIPVLAHLKPLNPMACDVILRLNVTLNMSDSAALDAFLAEVNDPASPLFHHYLSVQDYADRFGAPIAAITAVTTYLQQQGLQVQPIDANHLLIHVTGTVTQIEQAFGVTLANFSWNNRIVFAPTVEPSVPVQLKGMLQSIAGLDDVGQAHPIR